jgi:hypothetical protein
MKLKLPSMAYHGMVFVLNLVSNPKSNFMKKAIIAIVALFTIAALGSCSKGDKGDTGPQGATGANGTNGNANVTAYNFTATPSNWSWDASNNDYWATVAASEVTSSVVATGEISLFMSWDNTTWYPCPYSYFASGVYMIYSYAYATGNVYLYISNALGSTFTLPNEVYYKMVIIPASQRVAGGSAVNWKDWNQVAPLIGKNVKL